MLKVSQFFRYRKQKVINFLNNLECFEYSRDIPKKKVPGTFHTTVVGGELTKPGEFPHMTAIGWRLNNNEIDWKCGGSLISENFVVTAAHCITIKYRILKCSKQ